MNGHVLNLYMTLIRTLVKFDAPVWLSYLKESIIKSQENLENCSFYLTSLT